MDYRLTPEQEARSPHHGLAVGEWQLWCPAEGCTFKVEKNAAAKPICPDCGHRLLIAAGLRP